MAKARPKYVQELIDRVNARWSTLGEKDEHCELLMFMSSYLCEKNLYRGFNFFKVEFINGKVCTVLAGSADKAKYDFIQLY